MRILPAIAAASGVHRSEFRRKPIVWRGSQLPEAESRSTLDLHHLQSERSDPLVEWLLVRRDSFDLGLVPIHQGRQGVSDQHISAFHVTKERPPIDVSRFSDVVHGDIESASSNELRGRSEQLEALHPFRIVEESFEVDFRNDAEWLRPFGHTNYFT